MEKNKKRWHEIEHRLHIPTRGYADYAKASKEDAIMLLGHLGAEVCV